MSLTRSPRRRLRRRRDAWPIPLLWVTSAERLLIQAASSLLGISRGTQPAVENTREVIDVRRQKLQMNKDFQLRNVVAVHVGKES